MHRIRSLNPLIRSLNPLIRSLSPLIHSLNFLITKCIFEFLLITTMYFFIFLFFDDFVNFWREGSLG